MDESTKKYEIEPSFSVYDNEYGVCIKVGVSPDFPNNVVMSTPSDKDKEYYGVIHIDIPIEHAKKIADALYKQIEAMKKGV